MASTLAIVMYNWMTGLGEIRRQQGLSLTRDDFTAQWGDLGATIYDWGKNLTSQDPNAWQDYGKTEGVFEGMVDQLAGAHPVGGAMGQYYPQATPLPSQFGDMAEALYDLISRHVQANGGISRQALINSWGDLGLAAYDYMNNTTGNPNNGIIPDKAAFIKIVDYLANTYAPGGTQGFIYKPAQTPQGQIDAATLALLNQQIANARSSGAFTDAQAAQLQAQIANMPTVAQAQALVGQNLDNARAQGLISDANLAIAKANLANMPTPGQAQAQIQGQINLLNQQIDNARIQGLIDQATADKIKADIANMPTVAQAQALIAQNIENARSQGLVTQATADKIKADIALAIAQFEQQGQQFEVGASGYMGPNLAKMGASLMSDVQAQFASAGALHWGALIRDWGENLARATWTELVKRGAMAQNGTPTGALDAQSFSQWASSTMSVYPPEGQKGGALAQPQPTLDRQRIEADIKATLDRIRIAETQGNAQLALDERKRVDALQIALGQLGQQEAGITGYYGGQPTFAREQYGTELKANPRDWVKSWFFQRNQQAPAQAAGVTVPPWLNDIAQNKAAPAFSGQSATLGNFPLQAPAPNQVGAKVFNNMAPSEQAGLEGLASSSGWFWPDYIKKMYASQQRQPQIGANPTPQWVGF